MKLERVSAFLPIQMTLETQDEASLFIELLRHCSSKRQGSLKKFASQLAAGFDGLEALPSATGHAASIASAGSTLLPKNPEFSTGVDGS